MVGVWKASVDVQNPQVPPGPDATRIAYSMRHPTLDLKADHTFELRIGYPSTGTWAQSGQQITLTMKSVSGVNVDSGTPTGTTGSATPIVVTVSPDNKSIAMTGDQTITFTK
jgi:hypothetical protein